MLRYGEEPFKYFVKVGQGLRPQRKVNARQFRLFDVQLLGVSNFCQIQAAFR